VKYFNSISHIEKILIFDYSEHTGLVQRHEIVYFDINRENRRAVLIDGFVYCFFDTMAVSVNLNDGTVVQILELN
jgi:hypothetical protein